jgi:hypothetical protein
MISLMKVLSLPVGVLHELTHFAAAHAMTRQAGVAVEIYGGFGVLYDRTPATGEDETEDETEGDGSDSIGGVAIWPPIDSAPLRAFAHLSPTVFGAVLMGLWAWNGLSLDGWRLIMAVGLALYTIPSPADIRGALGIQDAQQETDNQ